MRRIFVTNLCDKFLWQIFVTNFCDEFSDEFRWQIFGTNFGDKFLWQIFVTNFFDECFLKIFRRFLLTSNLFTNASYVLHIDQKLKTTIVLNFMSFEILTLAGNTAMPCCPTPFSKISFTFKKSLSHFFKKVISLFKKGYLTF